MPAPKCSIVVANRYEDLWTKFIEGLESIPAGALYEVIKVDGNKPNFTYSKAMNEGLGRVDTEYVCFMNDDAHPLTKNWLSQIITVLDMGFIGVSPLEILKPENITMAGEMPPILPIKAIDQRPGTTNTLNGFCLVCRTADVRKVGGWSEEFRHFYEDNDLSIKLEELGWNAYAIKVYVAHDSKQTTKRALERDTDFMIKESKRRFKKKWGKTHKAACI